MVKLELPSIKLDLRNYESGFYILGSAHGTLCMFFGTIVLWNPSRKILKCIPPCPDIPRFGVAYCMFGYAKKLLCKVR